MFDWKRFEEHRSIFSQVGSGSYYELLGQHHVHLRPRDLLRWIEVAKEDLDYISLIDLAGVDRQNGTYHFELVYVLFNMGSHQRLNLHVHFDVGEIVPSIVPHYSQAGWMEREQAEMLGITFDRKTEKLLLPKETSFYPLRKDVSIRDWPLEETEAFPILPHNPNKSEAPYPEEAWVWKQFELLSPQTWGNFEWQVCFDPNKVVRSRTRVGFGHRGLEKLFESKPWDHILQLVDLINPGSSPTYAIAWAKTIEEMGRIKVPERAQAIRIVMLELARVIEHLTVLHEMTWCKGKDEHRFFLNCREKMKELFEKYSGHREALGIVRLGGMREDLPHGWINEFQNAGDIVARTVRLTHNALMSQRDFRSQLDHSGVNAQTVLQWGVGGPAMRASGLNFDLRKSQPLYFYQDIDFDIPVGIHGTSYDRYLIRYEEIHQSLRIITQVLDNLPLGEVMTSWNASDAELKGWHYSSLEAPNGEAGFLHLFGPGTPHRVKIKNPSFVLTQALSEFVSGLRESELTAAVASLGIRKFELDR